MTWQQWASVAFLDRHLLPTTSGIYVVADENSFVWYVGQATNLQNRWMGRAHHRYPQLIRTHKKLQHRIFWQPFPAGELDAKEQFYITLLRPELNGCKVKTYLPQQPQVEREIKRLFKVLNQNTLLFPILRSVVAGEYVNEAGVRCVLTIVFSNDAVLLGKSVSKRYSAEVRRAWREVSSLCGRSGDAYEPRLLLAYEVNGERFEFIVCSDFLRYLEDNPSLRGQMVTKGDLFDVEVAALGDLSVLDWVTLKDEYGFVRHGKRVLTDVAYLRYRRALLLPLQS